VFGRWLHRLADPHARARVLVRINRLAAGNFGDCKFLREGVVELRIDYGPGYRVYFSRVGPEIVLLLCGGDKRRQAADIARAVRYLKQYRGNR
jgi:putative addiction module killer protein